MPHEGFTVRGERELVQKRVQRELQALIRVAVRLRRRAGGAPARGHERRNRLNERRRCGGGPQRGLREDGGHGGECGDGGMRGIVGVCLCKGRAGLQQSTPL